MSNANFSRGMQSKTARAVGVMLVLILLLSGGAPEAAAGLWVRRDWSRVQIVTPGTRTTVLLYKDRAPRGQRKIKGVFYSARAESVTLLLPNGQTRTLLKQDVRKVLVRRPLKKRYQGWIAAGTGTALGVRGILHPGNDLNPLGNLLVAVVVIAAPTAITFLAAPRMGGIYFVPRDRREEAAEAGGKSRRP